MLGPYSEGVHGLLGEVGKATSEYNVGEGDGAGEGSLAQDRGKGVSHKIWGVLWGLSKIFRIGRVCQVQKGR